MPYIAIIVIRMRIAHTRIEPYGGDGETGFRQDNRIELVSLAFSGFTAKRRETREHRFSVPNVTPVIGHAG